MMEPFITAEGSRHRGELAELVVELASCSSGLRRSLPEGVVEALAELGRVTNCYYSHLIEGHDTHPVDIERAMQNDYSKDSRKRNLQLEARAHVTTQKWIDDGGLEGRPATCDGICELHRRLGELLSQESLIVEDPETEQQSKVLPGELRKEHVRLGNHMAIAPRAVPHFLERFEDLYSGLGKAATLFSAAAAHHRLLWIHPFGHGNGCVARLMSYAMLNDALNPGGLWSIARGLALQEASYREQLLACDQPRRGELDERGSPRQESLAEFTFFFLETCLDQIDFMENLLQPNQLRDRVRSWVEEEARAGNLQAKAGHVLEAVLVRGELPRGDVAGLVATGDRQARRIVSGLMGQGVLTSASPRAPLRIVFPASLAGRWMPGLFPD